MTHTTNPTIPWLLDHAILEAVRPSRPAIPARSAVALSLYAEAPAAHGSSHGLGLVHGLPRRDHRPRGSVGAGRAGRPGAVGRAFADIGIQAIHTGPMKQAGGLNGTDFTPTIDGHFDRIGLAIDPQFGTAEELQRHEPDCGCGGRGGDRRRHPGPPGQGRRLPPGRAGLRRLSPASSTWSRSRRTGNCCRPCRRAATRPTCRPRPWASLADKGAIVGELQRIIFYEPGVKRSN